MGGKVIFVLMFFVLLMTVSAELTQVDKAYIEKENQKTIAQINSQISTQSNRFEEIVKNKVDIANAEITTKVNQQINGSLKAIVVGLAGLMIIILALFKMIDMRLSHNRRIKLYEDELKKEKEELVKYRKQLDEYKVQFSNMIDQYKLPNQVTNTPTKTRPSRKKIILIVLGIVFTVTFITLLYLLFN